MTGLGRYKFFLTKEGETGHVFSRAGSNTYLLLFDSNLSEAVLFTVDNMVQWGFSLYGSPRERQAAVQQRLEWRREAEAVKRRLAGLTVTQAA